MSGASAEDPLEIIDDPSEIIASRLRRHAEPDGRHSIEASSSRSSTPGSQLPLRHANAAGAKRTLPPGFSSASTASTSSSRSGPSRPSHRVHEHNRVWNPPPRPREAELREKAAAAAAARHSSHEHTEASIPFVSGSGARVPNRFLEPDGSGPIRAGPSSSIDLTGEEEDDEPQLVSVKTGDIVADEVRNNEPVCLGVVQGVILCMQGCPQPIAADGPATKDPSKDTDPLWSRAQWPGVSRWILEPGYRPVLIKVKHAGPMIPRQAPAGQWAHHGHIANASAATRELSVSVILSPLAHQHEQNMYGLPNATSKLAPHVKEPFGSLSEKYASALEPLMARRIVNCEARCRLVDRGRASNFIHPVQILLFCLRPQVGLVSETLAQAGIILEQPSPGSYHPSDYQGNPPLVNPHGSSVSGGAAQQLAKANRFQPSHFMNPSAYSGTLRYTQTKEMTEEERRRQVETVYDELISGEDLPATEPSDLISTTLFPHQKQGLTFLLDRETERSFDHAPEATADSAPEFDAATLDDAAKDSVGLWKVSRSVTDGAIRTYTNILTQHEQTVPPEICRGAILADDMGLGKTITVIALLASTLAEARRFESGRAEASPQRGVARDHVGDGRDDGDDDQGPDVETMADGLMGNQTPAKKKSRKIAGGSSRKQTKKKAGKREAQRLDAERIRQQHLAARSRATLIVCPLTIVANWEEQVREHWDSYRPPDVYIYHGNSRSDDPAWIADHDIVVTTYATLASEFSNQSIWKDTLSAVTGEPEPEQAPDDDDDDFEMVDVDGRPTSQAGRKTQAKKSAKRKRSNQKEAANPLQRINWFRVVLDEAHTIKEVRTMQCRAVCNLTAQRRLSLTGTPVQNRLDDLYAQIRFLRLEPFSDRMIWNEHCGQRQKRGALTARSNANANNEPLEQVALVKVQTIMKFLTLRRTKETRTASGARLLELPPKSVRIVTLDFNEFERAKYNALHERYKEDFKEMEAADNVGSNYATILQEISNLRICCDDPDLIDASKDLKRLREGRSDFTRAIREDGLTRDRAAGLFEIFSEAAVAECVLCNTDLTAMVEDAGVKEDLTDEPLKARLRAVMTRCLHVFCSECFSKAVPQWQSPSVAQPTPLKADDRCECPLCGESLRTLLDIVQIDAPDMAAANGATSAMSSARASPRRGDPGDEQGDAGDFDWGSDEDEASTSNALTDRPSRNGFGCDRNVPVDERPGLGHKTRFLLSDLIPISMCNPASKLYDPDSPRLAHYVPTEDERAAQNGQVVDSVVMVPAESVPGGVPKTWKPIKSIVFSQWTTMLDRVEKAFFRAGIRTVRLDGRMKRPDRAAAMERFKKDASCEVFLISLRAGGFGLNLVSACRAYCIEPAWNPAQEQQAMDRVHRLGQDTAVIATKLVTRDSIETRMLEVQRRKEELANKVAEKRATSDAGGTREEAKAQRREDLRTLIA
ncbi:unnamed protein product [Parajaminaea phylloscopi]